ncbi:MAG: hypothetical protein R2932_00850 [Caldilineaceae bacterium]
MAVIDFVKLGINDLNQRHAIQKLYDEMQSKQEATPAATPTSEVQAAKVLAGLPSGKRTFVRRPTLRTKEPGAVALAGIPTMYHW